MARRQRRYRPLRSDPEIFNLDDIDINPRPLRLDIESIDTDERTTLNHPTVATTVPQTSVSHLYNQFFREKQKKKGKTRICRSFVIPPYRLIEKEPTPFSIGFFAIINCLFLFFIDPGNDNRKTVSISHEGIF